MSARLAVNCDRVARGAVALFLVTCLTGCQAGAPGLLTPVVEATRQASGDSVAVDFADVVGGEWSELGIICSFTSNAVVNEGLGFDWVGAPSFDNTSNDFLVFAADGVVVAWAEVPLGLGFCTYGAASTDGIRIVERGASQMTLERVPVEDPIGSLEEYWLVDPESVEVSREVLEGAPTP
jgi:hypothetical protein